MPGREFDGRIARTAAVGTFKFPDDVLRTVNAPACDLEEPESIDFLFIERRCKYKAERFKVNEEIMQMAGNVLN